MLKEKNENTEYIAGMENPDSLLEIRNLKMHFAIRKGLFGGSGGVVKAVDDISFDIKKGETLGLVGESGCGKSTVGRCIVRAYDITSGHMKFRQSKNGVDNLAVDLAGLNESQLRPLRRDIRMIFQDPHSSLNPRMTVFENVSEALRPLKQSRAEMQERVAYLLKRVGLRPEYMSRYPHAFSGGERQRIVIARALVTNPSLIVADEAVSALDVSVRAQILNLLKELQDEFGLTYLFISHDLSVIRHICDRVAVMYVGKLAETAECDDLFRRPMHPYSEALLSAVPIADPRRRGERDRIRLKGEVADPSNPPSGCYFHPRCRHAEDRCATEEPMIRSIKGDSKQLVSCHFAETLELEGVIKD